MPFKFIAPLSLVVLSGMAFADDATYRFEWVGSDGYRLVGALSFDARYETQPHIDESLIDCFEIHGYHNATPVGTWTLGERTHDTWWVLNFNPQRSAFYVFDGESGGAFFMPQAWNMDGAGTSCGTGGFGFNIGNAAQDICINGELIFASQVAPTTPLGAIRDDRYQFSPSACDGDLMLSALHQ